MQIDLKSPAIVYRTQGGELCQLARGVYVDEMDRVGMVVVEGPTQGVWFNVDAGTGRVNVLGAPHPRDVVATAEQPDCPPYLTTRPRTNIECAIVAAGWDNLVGLVPELTHRKVNRLRTGDTAHPHALKMLQYAVDAIDHPKPWLLWECSAPRGEGWDDLPAGAGWAPHVHYRRKPARNEQIAEATGVDADDVAKILEHLENEKCS